MTTAIPGTGGMLHGDKETNPGMDTIGEGDILLPYGHSYDRIA